MNKMARTFQVACVTLVAALAMGLTACKKNDNSATSTVVPPTVAPNWVGCSACAGTIPQPYPGLIGVHSSTTNENVLISIDLIVNQATNVNWNDPKAILAYAGPVTLQGVLRVVAAGDVMVCNAAPGDYEIRPLTSSMLAMGGQLSNGTFEALSGNGSRIVFRVGMSNVYNAQDPQGVSRTSQTNRVNLNMILDQVNGVYCGPLATR